MRAFAKFSSIPFAALFLILAMFTVPASAHDPDDATGQATLATAPAPPLAQEEGSADVPKPVTSPIVVIAPNVIPDVYKVCINGHCVWVEKLKYCAPTSACGAMALDPWTGGPCGIGCVWIAGRPYKVNIKDTYTNEESVRIAKCVASLGVVALDVVTKGFTRLALAGVAISAWGCS